MIYVTDPCNYVIWTSIASWSGGGRGGGVRKILSCLMLMKQREGSVMMQQAWEKILPGVLVLVKHC